MTTKYDELARLAEAADSVKFQSSGQALEAFLEFRDACHPEDIKAMHTALVKAQVDRDALAEALRAIVSVGGESTSGDGHARCRDLARAALARVKEEA